MPVYQYACTECGEQLEVRQSFSDDALTVCPACEGRLRKVLNAVGVVFKGSGFYRNDSRAATSTGSGSGTTNGAPGKDGGVKEVSPTKGAPQESAAKEPAAKNSGSKDSGPSNSGSKDSGPSNSGSKDSGSKDSGTGSGKGSSGGVKSGVGTR